MNLSPTSTESGYDDTMKRQYRVLVYTWRAGTNDETKKQDLVDTVSGLAGLIGQGASRAIASISTDASGFRVAYVEWNVATPIETAKTLSSWINWAQTRIDQTITTPVIETAIDIGKGLFDVAKIVWLVSIAVLIYIGWNMVQKAAGK